VNWSDLLTRRVFNKIQVFDQSIQNRKMLPHLSLFLMFMYVHLFC
jgi:hypothetical protein